MPSTISVARSEGSVIGYGDELMAAGEAQVLFERDGRKVAIVDRNGWPRWSDLWRDNPAIATPSEADREPVSKLTNGPNARPYNANVPFTRQSGVKFTPWRARDHRGKLYLTEQELFIGQSLRARIGPYWVVEPSPSAKSNANKRWSHDRFIQVVDAGTVTWAQPAHADSRWLAGANIVTTEAFRDACGLLASAEGYLGTEGGLHHAAAALGVRAVVLFGGCMSVESLGYPEHINLADTGPDSPCGRWVRCDHCAAAMARISVEDVLAAIWSLDP